MKHWKAVSDVMETPSGSYVPEIVRQIVGFIDAVVDAKTTPPVVDATAASFSDATRRDSEQAP